MLGKKSVHYNTRYNGNFLLKIKESDSLSKRIRVVKPSELEYIETTTIVYEYTVTQGDEINELAHNLYYISTNKDFINVSSVIILNNEIDDKREFLVPLTRIRGFME